MRCAILASGIAIAFFFAGCSKMALTSPDKSLLSDRTVLKTKTEKAHKFIDGAYIVVFNKTVSDVDAAVEEISKKHKFKSKHRFKHTIKGFAGKLTPEAVEKLRADPRVAYVEQDQQVSVSNHYQAYPPSWGLDRADQRALPLDGAYHYQHTGANVDAYIFDTGIRLSHEEFGGRAIMGFDAYPWLSSTDAHGHGTHVAGTVGGNSYGVAKGVRLIAIRVLGADGSGSWSDVAAGLDWVANHHTSNLAVANISLGGGPSQFVEDALKQAIADGITVCVAAMNDATDADHCSPARVREAITVGASDINDQYASFSNYGSAVDIFAPGVNIPSTSHASDYSVVGMSGTSMATPHVTGVAAIYLAGNPSATPEQVEAAIKANGTANQLYGVPSGTNNLLLNLDFDSPPPAALPFSVDLKAPVDQANEVTTSPVLSWYASVGTVFYNVQVSTAADFSTIVFEKMNIQGTTVSVIPLKANTVYYWRVNARNEVGTGAWSPTWNFNTFSGGMSGAIPSTYTPHNGATQVVMPTTLTWNPTSGARSYQLQVSTNSSFTNIVYKIANVTSNSIIVKGLSPGTDYYWRVSANYVYMVSNWSAYSAFRTL